MAIDNRTLRTVYNSYRYVIIVNVGVEKYISKGYTRRHDFDYTVLLSKAKKFHSETSAKKFIEDNSIVGRIGGFRRNFNTKRLILKEELMRQTFQRKSALLTLSASSNYFLLLFFKKYNIMYIVRK